MNTYKTLCNQAKAELIEKKSRFIATVCPVSSEQNAVELLNSLRSQYWDATHNVYAYVLLENNIKRYSDDGEPSGTAGVPVLNVLEKEGLFDVLVVVTRYFGGTLLGAGGLVRAYSAAAKKGIDAGGIVTRCLCSLIKITCSYDLWGRIQRLIMQKSLPLKDVAYSAVVEAYVYESCERAEKLMEELTDLTDAQATSQLCGQEFITLTGEGTLLL